MLQTKLRKHIKLLALKLHKSIILDIRGRLPNGMYEYSSGSFDLTVYPVRHKRRIMLSMVEFDGSVKETIVYTSGVIRTVKDTNELKEIRSELGYMVDHACSIAGDMVDYHRADKGIELENCCQ